MYKSYFNLSCNPFEITPDPYFLFATPRHNEALATLYHGIRGHKGFVVLTGEVGTGKTLLLRCLIRSLRESSDIAYAYVFNGRLSVLEFLQYVASEFNLPASSRNKGELFRNLSKFVIARGSKKLTTVLIVDEAHQLSEDVLEEIRVLTNLETAHEKLLQILLVGQPELDGKLDSYGLRQLKQRVAHRARLVPLNAGETAGYIERRLRLAGAKLNGSPLFPAEAIASVYRHAQGIPRLINTICENALLTAYARQMRGVTAEIIDGIAVDLRLDVISSPQNPNPPEFGEADAMRTAQTLLDLSSHLKRSPSREGKLRTPETTGVSEHEPII